MKNESSFSKSQKYFLDNQEKLAAENYAKFVVIHNGKVYDFYDDQLTAFLSAKKKFPSNSFVVAPCIPQEEEVKVIFHSRVQ